MAENIVKVKTFARRFKHYNLVVSFYLAKAGTSVPNKLRP